MCMGIARQSDASRGWNDIVNEYLILVSQIRKDKERLIQRLSRNISAQGDCKVWTGCSNNDGYPKMGVTPSCES